MTSTTIARRLFSPRSQSDASSICDSALESPSVPAASDDVGRSPVHEYRSPPQQRLATCREQSSSPFQQSPGVNPCESPSHDPPQTSPSPSGFHFGVPHDERPVQQTRSASYRLPSDDSDSESDEVQSSLLDGLQKLTPLEELLHDMHEQRKRHVTGAVLQQHEQLRQQVVEIERQLAEGMRLAQQEIQAKKAALEGQEEEAMREHSRRKDERLALLVARHQKTAALQQQHVAKLQDEAKRKAEAEAARLAAERRAAEQRAKEAEERKRKEEEEKRAAEDKRQAEEAARKQQADVAAAATQSAQGAAAASTAKAAGTSAATASGNKGGKSLRISASAAAAEKLLAEQLAAAEQLVAEFSTNDQYKKQRRDIEKSITKFVQQIAASQQQVTKKAQDLQQVIRSCNDDVSRTYASLTLAKKLLSQAEVQVLRLPSFAFPLATVAVAVATAYPPFMDHLISRLQKACIVAVPKYHVYVSTEMTEKQYFSSMGYREVEEKGGGMRWESTDEFTSRIQGYLLFYGAIVQVEMPGNPHPISAAWTFLARLLNALPANRVTATAIEAFLKAAGYRLHTTYRNQFVKMLRYIDAVYLPELSSSKDSDVQAVSVRLRTYCHVGAFQKPPEGSQMPEFDESSYNRA